MGAAVASSQDVVVGNEKPEGALSCPGQEVAVVAKQRGRARAKKHVGHNLQPKKERGDKHPCYLLVCTALSCHDTRYMCKNLGMN